MKAHTQEQPPPPSNSGTYSYLLSQYGPLMTLKQLAEVLRMTLTRHRQPLSIALSQSRRRLGRRVYFDAFGVAQAIDAEAGRVVTAGCPLSPAMDDTDAAIAGTWTGSPR